MNVLIVGCTRIGAALAESLCEKGHDVSVIDRREGAFDKLSESFTGLTFKGVPIDNDDLQTAGIEACDIVCVVTDDDNVNIMVAQIASDIYKIPKVLTLIKDIEKEDVFQECGLTSICPTRLTLDAVLSSIDDYEGQSYIQFGNRKVKFYSMPIPKELVDTRSIDIDYEENEILYAIIRNKNFTMVNNSNILLKEGDTLIFSKLVD